MIYLRLCALSVAAGLAPTAWLEMTAVEFIAARKRGGS